MRGSRGALLAGLLLTGLPLSSCDGPSTAFEYDLILVSVDTLRAERMSVYGAERDTDLAPDVLGSPSWLAAQGQTFEQCWAPAGKTVPSLATFWTGKEPHEHGAVTHVTPFQGATYTEQLAATGFRNFARVANRSVDPVLGFARGFESYALRPRITEPHVGTELLQEAAPVIRDGGKLMLWAHYMAPHQPYTPREGHDVYTRPSGGPEGDRPTLDRWHAEPGSASEADAEHVRALYDGEIRTASEYVRGFLSGLDRIYREAGRGGLLENAVVVFFSDHGEELGDHHGYWLHAKSLYSGVVRVPLLVAGPGFPSGTRIAAPIALREVLPWLLDGEPPDDERFVASWQSDFYSIRDERWTLVHAPCDALPNGPAEPPSAPFPYPEVALFDRSVDPLEQNDVSREHPEVTRRLLADLRAWYDGLDRVAPEVVEALSPAELSELGYTDDFLDRECEPWSPDRWRP